MAESGDLKVEGGRDPGDLKVPALAERGVKVEGS